MLIGAGGYLTAWIARLTRVFGPRGAGAGPGGADEADTVLVAADKLALAPAASTAATGTCETTEAGPLSDLEWPRAAPSSVLSAGARSR